MRHPLATAAAAIAAFEGVTVYFNTKASRGNDKAQTMSFSRHGGVENYWVCSPKHDGEETAPVDAPVWWATTATLAQIRSAGKQP
jgi:hypothetical protein